MSFLTPNSLDRLATISCLESACGDEHLNNDKFPTNALGIHPDSCH